MTDKPAEIAAMDEWCIKQLDKLKAPHEAHIMNGGSLDDPKYRRLLGQHEAFTRMRSFIHGSLRTKQEQNNDWRR